MDLNALLDELQHIARNGLHYSRNLYDRERYERLLTLATATYGNWLAQPPDAVRAAFTAELGHITPKVGADAAIFDADGHILLMDRADGSGWCLPCGWVEPGERPVDAAVREAREETGLEVVARRLVGVFARPPGPQFGPHTLVAVVHLCDVVGGALTLSHEGNDLRYWPIDAVPRWHGIHEKYARAAHALWLTDGDGAAVSD